MARNEDGISTGVPVIESNVASASEKPNSSAARIAPRGLHRPKITAASAMKPLPDEMFLLKMPTEPIVR